MYIYIPLPSGDAVLRCYGIPCACVYVLRLSQQFQQVRVVQRGRGNTYYIHIWPPGPGTKTEQTKGKLYKCCYGRSYRNYVKEDLGIEYIGVDRNLFRMNQLENDNLCNLLCFRPSLEVKCVIPRSTTRLTGIVDWAHSVTGRCHASWVAVCWVSVSDSVV